MSGVAEQFGARFSARRLAGIVLDEARSFVADPEFEKKHPRGPKGTPAGGDFIEKPDMHRVVAKPTAFGGKLRVFVAKTDGGSIRLDAERDNLNLSTGGMTRKSRLPFIYNPETDEWAVGHYALTVHSEMAELLGWDLDRCARGRMFPETGAFNVWTPEMLLGNISDTDPVLGSRLERHLEPAYRAALTRPPKLVLPDGRRVRAFFSETEGYYIADPDFEKKHPRGMRGSKTGGKFVEKPDAEQDDAEGKAVSAAQPKVLPPVQVRPAKKGQRAFTGEPIKLKMLLNKNQTGDLAEALAVAYLKARGFTDAETLNVGRNNFALDLVHDHRVLEVKAGLVSNGGSAQQWRATIGQPGKVEAAWLKTASAEEKAAHNAKKARAIMRRKAAAVREVSKHVGHPVTLSTLAMIIDPDRGTADLYQFPNAEARIGWRSPEAKRAYMGTLRFRIARQVAALAEAAAAKMKADDAEDETGVAPEAEETSTAGADVWEEIGASLETEAQAWIAAMVQRIGEIEAAGGGGGAEPKTHSVVWSDYIADPEFETKHPRGGKGTSVGGKFIKKPRGEKAVFGGVDVAGPWVPTKGMTLYHTSTEPIRALRDDQPLWLTPSPGKSRGYHRNALADTGNAVTYRVELKAVNVATEAQAARIAAGVFGGDESFSYTMLDAAVGEHPAEKVRAFIEALDAAGFDGVVHADYSAVDQVKDAYTLVVLHPARALGRLKRQLWEDYATLARLYFGAGSYAESGSELSAGQTRDQDIHWMAMNADLLDQRDVANLDSEAKRPVSGPRNRPGVPRQDGSAGPNLHANDPAARSLAAGAFQADDDLTQTKKPTIAWGWNAERPGHA